jgi:hypothetical protein
LATAGGDTNARVFIGKLLHRFRPWDVISIQKAPDGGVFARLVFFVDTAESEDGAGRRIDEFI